MTGKRPKCPHHPRRQVAAGRASCRGCLRRYSRYNEKRHKVGVPLADRETTVYVLVHPRTKVVRYVGSTTLSLPNRMTLHRQIVRGQRTGDGPLAAWLRGLGRAGLMPRGEVTVALPTERWGRAAEAGRINFETGEGRRLLNVNRPAGLGR